jgi:hypothetical protein
VRYCCVGFDVNDVVVAAVRGSASCSALSGSIRPAPKLSSRSIDDRRFTETIYRVALADGIMDRVNFQDLPEDAS